MNGFLGRGCVPASLIIPLGGGNGEGDGDGLDQGLVLSRAILLGKPIQGTILILTDHLPHLARHAHLKKNRIKWIILAHNLENNPIN